AAIRRWLGHDRPLPGFGHQLYPEGDPRATALLAAIDNNDETLRSLETAAIAATGAPANIDFALAVLTRGLGLPRDAPFQLFALGRSVGWAAHMVEQIVSGSIIRPRGRYEGLLT
ncbi:citrate synthase, partial [Mesorhizobium sp. M8A.F.Ca.ET.023.02.2.1]